MQIQLCIILWKKKDGQLHRSLWAGDSYLQKKKKKLIVRTTQTQGKCLEAPTISQMNRQAKKHWFRSLSIYFPIWKAQVRCTGISSARFHMKKKNHRYVKSSIICSQILMLDTALLRGRKHALLLSSFLLSFHPDSSCVKKFLTERSKKKFKGWYIFQTDTETVSKLPSLHPS